MEKNLMKRVDAGISSQGGLESLTSKLDIGSNSIYVKTAWLDGRVVHLDITLSRSGHFHCDAVRTGAEKLAEEFKALIEKGDVTPEAMDAILTAVAALETTNYDIARSWVEESCRMASKMLEAGIGIGDVISGWKGVYGFPNGPCPQLKMIVSSPLHAAAFLIERRIDDWKQLLTKQGAVL